MSGMYDSAVSRTRSSPPPESDDFSLLLHQILLRSSSSSSIVSPAVPPVSAQSGLHFPGSGYRVMHQTDSSSGLYFPNVSSSSVGTIDNDLEDYDCESEERGYETQVEEAPAKTAPSRNPAKRSRAAEVHNLSEKRRRSRINEKMKALQKLVPNSNKTDKASMLDEAIEYLKQLQLQVQMLTMRNGLSLYPVCVPGVYHPGQLPQMNLGFLEGNEPLDSTGLSHVVQEASNTPDHSCNPAYLPVHETSSAIHSGTSLGLGSLDQVPNMPTQLMHSREAHLPGP